MSAHRDIAATLLPGFAGTELPDWLARQLREGLGGVCVFGPNIVSPAQLRALTEAVYAANPDALIAIDEEGGDVTRLHYADGSPYPGNALLGRIDDLAYTEDVARTVGESLLQAGINLNFAPDVDVNSNPRNPVIGVRSFGADPELVARHSAAWTRGLQGAGVGATAKHFPGHGDTGQDSHVALPVVDADAATLAARELPPFRAVIDAGTKAIMSSHIIVSALDPSRPSTLSRPVLQGLLRQDLGFEGLIVSDALDMAGASGGLGIPTTAVRALEAGCDLLCIGTNNTDEQLVEIQQRIAVAIERGELDAARVADAATRIRSLARELREQRDAASPPARRHDSGVASRVGEAFDTQPHARQWLERSGDGFTVVRVETPDNFAIGSAPWGPFAEVAADPGSPCAGAFASNHVVAVREGDEPFQLPATPLLVIGKENHRHTFARRLIDRLRASEQPVLVVDMGWPSDDRAYADVATFGASRPAGRALLELLHQTAR